MSPEKIWSRFCENHEILERSVPLFKVGRDGCVETKSIGRESSRQVLVRSQEMEAMVLSEVDKLTHDWEGANHEFDGLIYQMFEIKGGTIVPLYIGKTETIGKLGANLSSNIRNLHTDKSKFARWGDNYAYHIGDLSAVAVPGHSEAHKTKKYFDWANSIFVNFPSDRLRLKKQTYFWAKSWSKKDISVWPEFGQTSLTFLEYLLIGVASTVFPANILNKEGKNRG